MTSERFTLEKHSRGKSVSILFGNWKTRSFEMKEDKLCYFDGGTLQGEFFIDEATQIRILKQNDPEADNKPNAFILENKIGKLTLNATSPQIRSYIIATWLAQINAIKSKYQMAQQELASLQASIQSNKDELTSILETDSRNSLPPLSFSDQSSTNSNSNSPYTLSDSDLILKAIDTLGIEKTTPSSSSSSSNSSLFSNESTLFSPPHLPLPPPPPPPLDPALLSQLLGIDVEKELMKGNDEKEGEYTPCTIFTTTTTTSSSFNDTTDTNSPSSSSPSSPSSSSSSKRKQEEQEKGGGEEEEDKGKQEEQGQEKEGDTLMSKEEWDPSMI